MDADMAGKYSERVGLLKSRSEVGILDSARALWLAAAD
jgi:hypothetical protein